MFPISFRSRGPDVRRSNSTFSVRNSFLFAPFFSLNTQPPSNSPHNGLRHGLHRGEGPGLQGARVGRGRPRVFSLVPGRRPLLRGCPLRSTPFPPAPASPRPAPRSLAPQCGTKGVERGVAWPGTGGAAVRRGCLRWGALVLFAVFGFCPPRLTPLPPPLHTTLPTGRVRRQRSGARPAGRAAVVPGALKIGGGRARTRAAPFALPAAPRLRESVPTPCAARQGAVPSIQIGGWGVRRRGRQAGSAKPRATEAREGERWSAADPSPRKALTLFHPPQAETFQKMAPAAITKVVGRQVIDSR